MIGLVVNPVAGVGGPAGLAGSDGADVQRLAASRGARSHVQERAALALTVLAARHPGLEVVTAAGAMGADAVRAAGLVPRVVYEPSLSSRGLAESGGRAESGDSPLNRPDLARVPDPTRSTEAADTARAVAALVEAGADLVLVVGGDGTLRDAAAGLGAVASAFTIQSERGGRPVPGPESDHAMPSLLNYERRTGEPEARMPAVLGVPAGVKMYSPVFAVSPRAAGALAADWVTRGGLPTADREVLDIDEAAMRRSRVEPTLYAMLRVPYLAGRTQARKAATPASEAAAVAAAARGAVARMRRGIRYLLGPGGTTAEIARQLGVEGSPLGVDVVLDGAVVVRAASEQRLLAEIALGPAQAVVTVIGGQGFLLGRGNQQLSASVLRALGDDPLLVVASEQKLLDLHGSPLLVDTGDLELDARLAGHVRIVTGVGTSSLYAVTAPELTPV
ncbi:NAD(+)/NADH kinase [Microbacterium sp. WCS2018Hpa-9]|uniref:ATP-NAD kinase family protein n=1 Tax=Microbacterium sp. WCS2018Hpa-9 TaxID=3073635 RepID=UPI00288AE331|nr:NAD(+)/NADH kinase [Microbacterium sp. WCS2018Hpa-9]